MTYAIITLASILTVYYALKVSAQSYIDSVLDDPTAGVVPVEGQ
jgi:hypothetical protein